MRPMQDLVSALTAGDIRACARLISRIERGDDALTPILQALYRIGGRARVVGVTGPPGAGKSTLVGKLVGHWRRCNLRVAVLAVDPSSPFSGGAVLGDRLRMTDHGADDGVFIRSMAARGHLGGLARAAGDAIVVLDAMPWDVLLVETVGVGQNETEIMRHAQVVVLVQTPMGGDDIQAAKAGIMEIGDIFIVNKSDHPDAERAVRLIDDVISRGQRLHPERVWRPPVLKTRAVQGEGVPELADQIDRCFAMLARHPELARARLLERTRHRVGQLLRDLVDRRIRSGDNAWLDDMIEPLVTRDSDPYSAASALMSRVAS